MPRLSAIQVLLLFLAISNCGLLTTRAQELQGAKKLIEEISDQADKITQELQATEFDKMLAELPAKLAKLPPKEAAAAWVKAVDRWASEGKADSFSTLIAALPAPESWMEVAKLVDAREESARLEGGQRSRQFCLQALAYRLIGDLDSLHRILREADDEAAEFLKRSEEDNPDGADEDDIRWANVTREKIEELEAMINPLWQVERFKEEIAQKPEKDRMEVKVPDLVTLVGRDEASKLIGQAFANEHIALQFQTGIRLDPPGETLALAIENAVKAPEQFKHPIWALCFSLEATELFEHFEKLPTSEHEWRTSRDDALAWCLLGLVAKGREQDALDVITKRAAGSRDAQHDLFRIRVDLNWESVSVMRDADKVPELYQFLLRLREAYPTLDVGDALIRCAYHLGGQEKVDEFLAKYPRRDASSQDAVERRAAAHFRADRVEEGIAEMLSMVNSGREALQKEDGRSAGNEMQFALDIAKIGLLLDRKDWVTQGLDSAAEFLAARSYESNDTGRLVAVYRKAGQFDKAEQMSRESIARAVAAKQRAQTSWVGAQYGDYRNLPSQLNDLAITYFMSERYSDVISLLEEAPWWDATDLADQTHGMTGPSRPDDGEPRLFLPDIAARSLAKIGRTAEARKIAEAIVHHYAGNDPTWQLLLEITGEDFEKLATEAIARDRFEERPYIWLAKFFLIKGDLAKAEALVRKAIEIDPSDGDQPHGARLLAYDVLSQICREKGDDANAKLYEGAVKAIRLAEKADDFLAAGLTKRAIELYQESLTYFADAYCIQSRLAIQLEYSGDLKGAEKHYERAFELMPQSFGNLEVDCTGCSGVFSSELGQSASERVFKRLLEADPKNPRLYYLMARAKLSAGEDFEAVRLLKEATRLDPDYLSAWNLLDTYDLKFPKEEAPLKEETSFALLRLDPRSRHSNVTLDNVQDLARFWRVAHDAARQTPEAPAKPLFRLKAVPYDPQRARGDIYFQSWRESRFNGHPQLVLFAEWMQMGEEEEQ